MYQKKTLSAASLLSECERKRRRSLEARGCAKSESEFSMGTAATCPFPMSEQSPRSIKLHQSVYARRNKPALRQTEIFHFIRRADIFHTEPLRGFLPAPLPLRHQDYPAPGQ